jgi:hypothetical protein
MLHSMNQLGLYSCAVCRINTAISVPSYESVRAPFTSRALILEPMPIGTSGPVTHR